MQASHSAHPKFLEPTCGVMHLDASSANTLNTVSLHIVQLETVAYVLVFVCSRFSMTQKYAHLRVHASEHLSMCICVQCSR